jgi:hypothetical protein
MASPTSRNDNHAVILNLSHYSILNFFKSFFTLKIKPIIWLICKLDLKNYSSFELMTKIFKMANSFAEPSIVSDFSITDSILFISWFTAYLVVSSSNDISLLLPQTRYGSEKYIKTLLVVFQSYYFRQLRCFCRKLKSKYLPIMFWSLCRYVNA